MKSLLAIVAAICLCFCVPQESQAQLLNRPIQTGLNWNYDCAVQSAAQYVACRQNGGGYFSCLANSGIAYWACSGSNFESSFRRVNRVRAVVVGMRIQRLR